MLSRAGVLWFFRALLQREPGKSALQKDLTALRAGSVTLNALIDILIVSHEFKNRRPKVLVVHDHPQCNASSLRYYAEVDRVPLSFSHILEGPITTQQLQEFACILVKDTGYQGPEFSTRYTAQIDQELLRPGSGFVPLPAHFPFPDHSRSTASTSVPLRGNATCSPKNSPKACLESFTGNETQHEEVSGSCVGMA